MSARLIALTVPAFLVFTVVFNHFGKIVVPGVPYPLFSL